MAYLNSVVASVIWDNLRDLPLLFIAKNTVQTFCIAPTSPPPSC